MSAEPGTGGATGDSLNPDGELVGGPKTPQQAAAQKRLQQTQAQVDEVVGIMRVNVERVLERDQKLSELDNRADALQQGASQFEQSAGKLKRKMWWKNIKMMIIMGVVFLILLIIIIAKYMPEGAIESVAEATGVSGSSDQNNESKGGGGKGSSSLQ